METQSDEMRLKKHRGAPVKRGGVFVREADYNGHFAVRFQTESGEEHEFVLTRAQVDRLNTLTEDPVGQCVTEKSRITRLVEWLTRAN